MEFANENGDHVDQKIDDNDIAGLEANGGQESYMGMKFEHMNMLIFSTIIMLNVLDLACSLRLVIVQKVVDNLLM